MEKLAAPTLEKVADVKRVFGQSSRVIEHKPALVCAIALPSLNYNPDWQSLADDKLHVEESHIAHCIDAAEGAGDSFVVTFYKGRMRQLQAERARRNGNANSKAHELKKLAEPLFVTMDTIEPETVDWIWWNRIPIGRLTLIDGDPGAGKSFVSLKIAASLSRGALPGGKPTAPRHVLLLSIEDGFADTVRPRLDAMGADVSRIIIPNPRRGLEPSSLNAGFIETVAKAAGPALVVVDPIIAFSGKRDPDKAGQVRELLAPLMALAERHSFACILIRHLNKGDGNRALYRGSGSIDFVAAARSAFVVAQDPETEGRRVFAHVKNTLAPLQRSLEFFINEAIGFRWGAEIDTGADELLAATRNTGRNREPKQLEAAKRLLHETLASGPMPSKAIFEKAGAAGISNATLFRAKGELKVKASKKGGNLNGEWLWQFAEDAQPSREDAQVAPRAREYE